MTTTLPPWWIALIVGVLAFVGSIGGTWGGQWIAGRNDAARWKRERDRESQAFWRDKRLEAYSRVLAEVEDVAGNIRAMIEPNTFYLRREGGSVYDLDRAEHELHTISLIGSNDAISMLSDFAHRSSLLVSSARHPSRGRDKANMTDLHLEADALTLMSVAIGDQFRRHLGIVPPTT